jgi:hypothetical protein
VSALWLLAWAWAHDVQPGAIALREVEPDAWLVRVVPPQDGGGLAVPMAPRWPPGCTLDAGLLRCTHGLRGELTVPGLASRQVKVVVDVRGNSGAQQVVLHEGQDAVWLGAAGGWGLFTLGCAHVLGGLDHVGFVLGLALVSTGWQRVGAITAFTLAHSLTLALTATGWRWWEPAAVELLIAASLVVLAREALVRPADARGRPARAAAVLGLVHGVGFAGGLAEAGLEGEGLLWGLLSFNLGVEAAQLVVLTGAVLVGWLAARVGVGGPARVAAAYALGLTASVWTVERAWLWLS